MELARDFFLYSLSFLLLLEWLFPLPYISDTGFMNIIYFVAGILFLVTFLQFPVWVSIPIKIAMIYFGLCLVFFEGNFFSMESITILLLEIGENISLMMNGQWYALTDLFRSILFFVLLAIMSYLLFYWTIQVRRILFFLFFTIVYVAVIDTFSSYDATFAMIRTFVIGFLLLGLVTIYRRVEGENTGLASRFLPARLAALLVMMVVAGGIFGFLFPKPEPQWADPVPFVRAAIGMEHDGTGAMERKIGYGDNDEHLGGGFTDDDTPVFYAAATEEHYWRGETKDYYTGKGWEQATPFVEGREPNFANSDEVLEAEVVFSEGMPRFSHLFYPGILMTEHSVMDVELSIDRYSTKARTFLDASPINLSHYHYEYVLPQHDVESLRSAHENDSDEVVQYYTQLPDNLPERVAELAEELMEDADNRYDRAKAVETYLSGSTFKYETTNVPIPEEDEDYVDQFLFESQRGYCDNFSSSMVVLLRTQDIPARWAKGFTQGESIETLDEDRSVYQVTNGNAHSWVEVYFPEFGWVPFEPTRGFDYAYDAVEELDPLNLENDEEEEKEEEESANEEDEDDQSENGSFFSRNINAGGFWLLLVLAIIIFVLLKNKKVAYYFTLKRFKNREDESAFMSAYEQLLWLLRHYGYERQNGETLREYAIRMDQQFSSDEMVKLTREYEEIMYGGKPFHSSWRMQKPNWEAFLQKIQS